MPSDSGLPFPMDVTNASGLGFGFDSTISDEFDLGSLSMAYPSVNNIPTSIHIRSQNIGEPLDQISKKLGRALFLEFFCIFE